MSKYQAKLKQKIQETAKKPVHETEIKKPKKSGGGLMVFAVLCVIIGSAVAIGFGLQNTPGNPNNTTTTIPNGNTDGTSGGTPYKLSQTITTSSGETIRLADYQGKRLLLLFTSTTCPTCEAQLPSLISGYNTNIGGGNFEMISLEIGSASNSEISSWRSSKNIPWKTAKDSGLALSGYFSVYSLATYKLIDENGNVITTYVGSLTQEQVDTMFATLNQ